MLLDRLDTEILLPKWEKLNGVRNFNGIVNATSRPAFMQVEDDDKEGNVALNATQFKVIEGGKGQAPPSPTDESARELESLFREHHDRVFRAAYRVTGSVVDAEDVLQTVFLRLSRRAGNINLDPSPASYLHRAAINASLDLMRQRARTDSIPLDDVAPVLAASARLNPELQSRNSEMRAGLRRAIAKLGEKSAEMFVLKYFEGYDNTEIASAMGTSAMVVGVLLHRARTRVKKEMGDFLEGGLVSL
jgi:RNA polymerase sigma-70 factor (ECF subfamily)